MLGDTTLYDQMKEHILTKALLKENNYPHKHPDKVGFAIQYGDTKKGSTDGGSSEIIFLFDFFLYLTEFHNIVEQHLITFMEKG